MRYFTRIASIACTILLLLGSTSGATPPAGFQNQFVTSLSQPMDLIFLPDGRMLVLQKTGEVMVADPNANPVTTSLYLDITNIEADGDHGLTSIALDPDFANNGYFYLYYSTASPPRYRVSRFEHLGTTSSLATETMIWESSHEFDACCHFGGGMGFGPDGLLYLATGEEFNGVNAQDLSHTGGSIIRIHADGSIPADNPYVGVEGADPSIWAIGLRNPFSASWDFETNQFFIGDVGGNVQSTAMEEINVGVAGANYGWPLCEGASDNPDFPTCDPHLHTSPLYDYPHIGNNASVIVGGIYRGTQFPEEYQGALFYGDYTRRFIRYLTFDPAGITGSHAFEPEAAEVAAIRFSDDGSLYFAAFNGQIRRIVYLDQPPSIDTFEATPAAGLAPLEVGFSALVSSTDGDPLDLTWTFGDGSESVSSNVPSGTVANVTHTYNQNGVYTARLTATSGGQDSLSDPIDIRVGSPPTATILMPFDGAPFRAQDIITYSGSATDSDGPLTDSSYTWIIPFHHDDHTHPGHGPVQGPSGDFEIPNTDHDYRDDTSYEITLTVTDADGLTGSDTLFILPDKVDIVFDTLPQGLSFGIDGVSTQAPFVLDTLIGFQHVLSAPSQCIDDQLYEFVGWSHGEAATHTFVVPETNQSLVANFETVGPCFPASGLVMHLNTGQGLETSGTSITRWFDQSPNGNDLTTTDGAPMLMANAINGRPAVYLDGINDVMSTTDLLGLPNGNGDRTVFLVASYRSDGPGGFVWGNSVPGEGFGLGVSGGNLAVLGGDATADRVSATAGNGADWLIQSVTVSSGAYTHNVFDTTVDSGAYTWQTGAGQVLLGGDLDHSQATPAAASLDVAEVLVYNRALDAAEQQQILDFLNSKYFPVVNVPPTVADDALNARIGVATDLPVMANDEDDQDLSLSEVGLVDLPMHGTITAADPVAGTVTYLHDGSASTRDSFSYVLTDDAGATSVIATVEISLVDGDFPLVDGLAFHIEADTGVETSDGTVVTRWLDFSGVGNHLDVPTSEPAWIQGGSGSPNGQPYIAFDGNLDRLEARDHIHGPPEGPDDRTVFVVVDYKSVGFGGFAYGNNSCNQTFGLVVTNQGNLAMQGWCGSNDFLTGEPGTGIGWFVHSATVDSSEVRHFKDGLEIDRFTHTYATEAHQGRIMLGAEIDGSPSVAMNVAAVLIYDSALSELDRIAVEDYLQSKYLGHGFENQAPTTAPDFVGIPAGGSADLDVLSNDSDTDGGLDPASVILETTPTQGTVTGIDPATGVITYVHGGSDLGDTFTYSVADALGERSTAVVTINLLAGDPLPVATGLVLRLESDNGVVASGGTVTAWTDLSGAGNDLTAVGGPTYGATTPSGQAAVSLDGMDDRLDRTGGLVNLPGGNADRTVFAVLDYRSNGFGGVAYGSTSCNQVFGLVTTNGGKLGIQGWCGGNDLLSTVTGTGAGWLTQSVILDGGQLLHYKDGVLIQNTHHSFNTDAAGVLRVGAEIDGNPHVQMGIAALLVYDRALAEAERLEIEGYLQLKYLDQTLVNQPPTAVDDLVTLSAGSAIDLQVLDNDSDDGGSLDPSSVTVVTAPTYGSAVVDPATGAIAYTHDGSANGDTFTYTVADASGLVSNAATVTINLSVDTPLPVVNGLVLHLESDAGVATGGASVTAWNDLSGLGNHLTAVGNPTLTSGTPSGQPLVRLDGLDDRFDRLTGLVGMPSGGTDRSLFAVVNYLGTGFGGIAYGSTACNQVFGLIVTSSGELAVQGWCAGNDFFAGTQGTGAGWMTQAAIVDANNLFHYRDGTAIDATGHTFQTDANGRLTIGAEIDGNPPVHMEVAAVLVYNRALTETERLDIETYLQDKYLDQAPVNAPPVAANDGVTVEPGATAVLDVLLNDTDDGGVIDPATVTVVTAPAHGTVDSIDPATGAITYTHDGSANGDSLTYTVADLTGLVSNVATVDISLTTSSPLPVSAGLVLHLESDNGLMTSGLQVTGWNDLSGQGNHLGAIGSPDTATATPSGAAAVHLDGVGDQLARTSTLNGLPGGNADRTLFAVVNYLGTGYGGIAYGQTSCNRVFGPIVTSQGELAVQGWCGGNDFHAGVQGTGTGWMTQGVVLAADALAHYRDGTLIDSANHVFDTDAGGSLRIGAEIDGNPPVRMEVAAVLAYDRTLSEAERLAIETYLQEKYLATVPTDDPPVANGDTVTLDAGATTSVDVLANDSDDNGLLDPSTVTVVSGPSHGTVDTIDAVTGAITYTHDGSDQPDSFTYTVDDAAGQTSNVATVTVNLTAANAAPVAADDAVTVNPGAGTTVDVLANDSDDGSLDPSTVTVVSGPSHGTVDTIDAVTGAIAYTHDGSANADSFTYTVDDAEGLTSNVATVTVNLNVVVSPLPVSSGVVLHLETDDGLATSGASVTGWNDQSGNGNHLSAVASPDTNASTPTGATAVRFDGFGDKLQRIGGLTGLPTGNGDRTVLAVVHYRGTGYGGIAFGTNSCNQVFGLIVTNQGDLAVQGWCGGNDFNAGVTGTGAGWMTQTVVLDSSNLRHYRDGGLIDDQNHTFDTADGRIMLGAEIDGNPPVAMDVAALVVYDRALSEAERLTMETYLQEKYLAQTPTDDPPVANDDAAAISAGATVTIDVLANDSDDGGAIDASTLTVVDAPTAGTIDTIDPSTGVVTYTHGGGTDGDTFTYTVDDGTGQTSNLATVTVSLITEGDLPVVTGLALHFEADSGLTTSGSTVTAWDDLSGQGNHLTAVGTPDTTVLTPSGAQAVHFDGAIDKMQRIGTSGLPSGNGDRTMFAVVRYNGTGWGGIAFGNPGCNQVFGLIVTNQGELAIQGWCGGNDFFAGTQGTGAGWMVQSATHAAGNLTHAVDGATVATHTHTFNTAANGRIMLGAEIDSNPPVAMDVAAVLVYDRALSAAERGLVEAYLAGKYVVD